MRDSAPVRRAAARALVQRSAAIFQNVGKPEVTPAWDEENRRVVLDAVISSLLVEMDDQIIRQEIEFLYRSGWLRETATPDNLIIMEVLEKAERFGSSEVQEYAAQCRQDLEKQLLRARSERKALEEERALRDQRRRFEEGRRREARRQASERDAIRNQLVKEAEAKVARANRATASGPFKCFQCKGNGRHFSRNILSQELNIGPPCKACGGSGVVDLRQAAETLPIVSNSFSGWHDDRGDDAACPYAVLTYDQILLAVEEWRHGSIPVISPRSENISLILEGPSLTVYRVARSGYVLVISGSTYKYDYGSRFL